MLEFLKFAKADGWEEWDGIFRDVHPKDWNCYDCTRTTDDPYVFLQRFMRYNSVRRHEKEQDETLLYKSCVERLDVLIEYVWDEFKQMRYHFWLDGER